MRRLDALAAFLSVLAVAFLACSPDPLDEAVPHSGGTAPPPSAAPGATCAPDGSWCISATSTVVTTSTTAPATTSTVVPETTAAPTMTTTVPPSTVPATTAPPPPTTAARAGGCFGYRDLVAVHFPASQIGNVCSVMDCESEGFAGAVGKAGERGLMQIHPVNRPALRLAGLTWGSMFEPDSNLRFAASLWRERGWGPWTCQP